MRKSIIVKRDGRELEVAPLTLQEFASLGIFAGDAKQAYAEWKEQNEFAELSDFDADDIELILSPEAPVWPEKIKFRPMGKEWLFAKDNWLSGPIQVVDI